MLTAFEWTRGDPRLLDMARHLDAWFDAEGRLTPASVWKAWEGWEFAQKKEPSRWVTLLAWEALLRVGRSDSRPDRWRRAGWARFPNGC